MSLFHRQIHPLSIIFIIAACLNPAWSWANNDLTTTQIEALTDKANNGELQAQAKLAEYFYKGKGIKQDYAKAAFWYKKLAESEVAQAQLTLAMMYIQGNGVAQNDKEAIKWLVRAAEQLFPEAQYLLGLAYAEGHGVTKNLAEAYMWYEISAAMDYKHAVEARAALAKELSVKEITKAEEMASKWWRKFHH